jgi:NADPH-dependent curcumin reductase CurA
MGLPVSRPISVCSNAGDPRRGTPAIISKRLTVRGFIVTDFFSQAAQALSDLEGWVRSGELKVLEDIVDGFENLPAALVGLLAGENIGKRMVKVA